MGKESVGGLFGADGVAGKAEARAGDGEVAAAHVLPGAHVLEDVLLGPRGEGILLISRQGRIEINVGQTMQLPVHALRVGDFGRR